MSDDFAPLEDELQRLAETIAPAERKKLAGAVATDLRNANAKRIRANLTPEGEAMEPRKPKASGNFRPKRLRDQITKLRRSVKSERMFRRATASGYLRKVSSAGEAQVGFVGAMSRIMSVHHYGLRDTVTRDAGSPEVAYPERPILGLDADDRVRILDKVADALAG